VFLILLIVSFCKAAACETCERVVLAGSSLLDSVHYAAN